MLPIKKTRLSLGMNQREFAKAFGVCFATINRIENEHIDGLKYEAKLEKFIRDNNITFPENGLSKKIAIMFLDRLKTVAMNLETQSMHIDVLIEEIKAYT